jgi:UDP-N-acetylglucosamine--N-acetylmuramyl-(pentapeptide) pyrophosphoryl-undecaprenol N-acetylglucosamine transferase
MNESENILLKTDLESKSSHRIIISGGGTGGHIFPALSIANALKAVDKNIEILFVGAQDRMEMEKVPAAGYKIIGLPIAGIQRKNILKNFKVLLKVIQSLVKANKILNDFKPELVAGVGGYASGPMLWMASKKGIPVIIQEQNSYAGITNKLLSRKAEKIFVAYPGMEKYFPSQKIVLAGNPVRKGLEDIKKLKEGAYTYFGLDPTLTTIFCTGGSLGARTINQSISASLDKIGQSNLQFIWQCGSYYFAEAKRILENTAYNNIKLYDFISRMDLAYAAADVVISRAGAGSISELSITGKAAILVPSPNVAEDHQTRNAMALAGKNAAIIIKDSDAKDKLISTAIELSDNKQLIQEMSENISKLALHDSAGIITKEIINIIKRLKND